MQRALKEAAKECLNLAFFLLPTGLQHHLARLHQSPALCCMESRNTTSGIFSEPPKYPSVSHLPLTSRFAEWHSRVRFSLFSGCQS